MVQSLSETVILPIAGVILAFVMTLELIQIITDKNNFHDIETAVFFKWIFKTACAILIVTNTWNIAVSYTHLMSCPFSKKKNRHSFWTRWTANRPPPPFPKPSGSRNSARRGVYP